MRVILLENIHGLGGLGDNVRVKPGYARNFLIPQGKALAATPENVAEFEARRAELERQQAEIVAAARARAEGFEGTEVTIACKAGEEGRLFGSVGPRDVAEALAAEGKPVERHEVQLGGEVIRKTGDYQATLLLHAEVEVPITVHVVRAE